MTIAQQIDNVLAQEDAEVRRAEWRARVLAKASELEKTMRCFCDLDRWEPEIETGHSWVCPIHKEAVRP